jgi:tRNA threonylcarbamoyladenosine modification (KEOPS) complex  Pcc1 subunit
VSDVHTAVRRFSSSQGQETLKSKRFRLESSILVSADAKSIDTLEAVLSDEERRIGERSGYTYERNNAGIIIKLHANDAIALKAIVSSVTMLIKLVEDGASL